MNVSLELELATTEQLIEQLTARYDHLVVAGIKAHPLPDRPHEFIRMWRFKGNGETCQGLACGLISNIQKYTENTDEELGIGDV